MQEKLENRNIILGVTGSIAAYKACDLVSKLVQGKAHVQVVMTPNALQLVSHHTFAALSGQAVAYEMFKEYQNKKPKHIDIASWGDILVIAPATANIIGKIAGGIADDILSTTVMTFNKKILIAPAMNTNMYENSMVQENIGKLKKYGMLFIEPDEGYLACGYEGKGRLASIQTIIEKICQEI